MKSSVPKPKVIFLDAVGTLFSIQRTVGAIYAQIAARHQIDVAAEALNCEFLRVFKRLHAPAFSGYASPTELARLEKQWWHSVVLETFQGVLDEFDIDAFNLFFDEVFDYFATAMAWTLYPEVLPTLQLWSNQGIQLGIISNFDGRLGQVLDELAIAKFFQTVTVSSQVGVPKPDPQIFRVALAKHLCTPETALHIGDQWQDDVEGARLAGLKGIWLNRDRDRREYSKLDHIAALDELRWFA